MFFRWWPLLAAIVYMGMVVVAIGQTMSKLPAPPAQPPAPASAPAPSLSPEARLMLEQAQEQGLISQINALRQEILQFDEKVMWWDKCVQSTVCWSWAASAPIPAKH